MEFWEVRREIFKEGVEVLVGEEEIYWFFMKFKVKKNVLRFYNFIGYVCCKYFKKF